jgi:hypothetical protein
MKSIINHIQASITSEATCKLG